MQEIARSNRADFAITEETSERNGSRRLGNYTAIMVWLPIEMRATAIAGKE
jgi:hypothetical protein